MNLNINNIIDIEKIAEIISFSINEKLQLGKSVLWFISGGSAIPLEVEIAKKIKKDFQNKLVVTLIDERYDAVGHPASNWANILDKGFILPGSKLVPILNGKDIFLTTLDFKEILKNELNNADYKIGIFGIGIDGHTAGILQHSEAVYNNDLVCYYNTELYNRITITPKTIYMLDEAFVYAMGENKWGVLKKLEEDLLIEDQPAQILKKVPLLTIFTDYTP